MALPPDAAVAVAEKPVRPAAPAEGPLEITVTPRGAVVYLDGARKGTSPIELAGSGDRHKLVVMMRGHELHREDIAGAGKIEVTLQPIPRWTRGPAGIKVRCKSRDRLYVIIDGKHTGELCPSERIPVPLGEHTVEVFDPVTDTTVTEKANIKDADHSHRIVVDN